MNLVLGRSLSLRVNTEGGLEVHSGLSHTNYLV
jgi:hypothetical protein